jgi:hypothetical protein
VVYFALVSAVPEYWMMMKMMMMMMMMMMMTTMILIMKEEGEVGEQTKAILLQVADVEEKVEEEEDDVLVVVDQLVIVEGMTIMKKGLNGTVLDVVVADVVGDDASTALHVIEAAAFLVWDYDPLHQHVLSHHDAYSQQYACQHQHLHQCSGAIEHQHLHQWKWKGSDVGEHQRCKQQSLKTMKSTVVLFAHDVDLDEMDIVVVVEDDVVAYCVDVVE